MMQRQADGQCKVEPASGETRQISGKLLDPASPEAMPHLQCARDVSH